LSLINYELSFVDSLSADSTAKIYFRIIIKTESMHFLSHYYVDRDKNNPLFVAGALLPDIAPHFTKTYNTQIRNKNWQLTEPLASIHKGVLRHYELDVIFHNSVAFREACAEAGRWLGETGLDREKYRFWFLSHIVCEVMLDRQLIMREPHLIEEYYKVLSSVDIYTLDAYLNLITAKDEKNKILTNFIKFLDVRFLKYMEEIDGAAEGIVRTVLRATGVAFTEEDKKRLVSALHNIENDIRYRSKNLLKV
jgi:hypothetical protein